MTSPCGLVLAGGQSRRMGKDKTLLILDGKPLISHVIERLKPQTSGLTIAGPRSLEPLTGLSTIADATEDAAGPLSAIVAGLRHMKQTRPDAKLLLTAPADCPFLPPDLAARLLARSGARPVVAISSGRLHPVVALWPIHLLSDLETALFTRQERRMQAVLEHCGFETQPFDLVDSRNGMRDPFLNINTPEDFENATQLAGTRQA